MTNPQKSKNRVGFYLPLFAIAVPLTVALRTIAYLNNLNAQGHFEEKSLVLAANIITAFFSIIFLLHSFSHHRNDSTPEEGFSNYLTYVPSGLLSATVIFAVYELTHPVISAIAKGEVLHINEALTIAAAILGIAMAASFLINALIENRHSQLRASFGIFTALFLSLYSICIYLDSSVAANVQQRSLTIISLILAAAFFLFEVRISIGRSKWHAYVAFGLSSATLLYYASIPALVHYFAKGTLVPGSSLIQLIAMLTLGIYATCRVFLIAYAREDEVSEVADAILDMAHERQKKKDALARVNILKEEKEQDTSSEND